MRKIRLLIIFIFLSSINIFSGSAGGSANSYNIILEGNIRIVTDDNLRIRETPSTDSKVIGVANTYDFLVILEKGNKQQIGTLNNYWYKILTTNEQEIIGWVYGEWLGENLQKVKNNKKIYDNITLLFKKFNIFKRYEIDTDMGQHGTQDIFYKQNYQLTMDMDPSNKQINGYIKLKMTNFNEINKNDGNIYLLITINPDINGYHYMKYIEGIGLSSVMNESPNEKYDLLPYLMIGYIKQK